MVIVVGYAPGLPGEAALRRGAEEARLRGARLVVVNSSRGDALVDRRFGAGTPRRRSSSRRTRRAPT